MSRLLLCSLLNKSPGNNLNYSPSYCLNWKHFPESVFVVAGTVEKLLPARPGGEVITHSWSQSASSLLQAGNAEIPPLGGDPTHPSPSGANRGLYQDRERTKIGSWQHARNVHHILNYGGNNRLCVQTWWNRTKKRLKAAGGHMFLRWPNIPDEERKGHWSESFFQQCA